MSNLSTYTNKISDSVKALLGISVSKDIKDSVYIISLSKADLIKSLGQKKGASLFKKVKGNLGVLGGSKGTKIKSIQRLTSSDIGSLGRNNHLYYDRGDFLAIVTTSKSKATLRMNGAIERSLKGSESSDEVLDIEEIVTNKTAPDKLISVDTTYQIKSGYVVSLAKQVSKFTVNVKVIVPKQLDVDRVQKSILNNIIKNKRVPIDIISKQLNSLLEFMSEKKPSGTSKKAGIRKKTYTGKFVTSSSRVKVSSSKANIDASKISNASISSILAALNAELKPALKAIMHSKSEPANKRYLRYQSGRFANSVVATKLSITPKSITAIYNYQNKPYDVFNPNRSSYKGLSSTGRNPVNIIGRAIRTVLKTQLIKNKLKNRRIFTREDS